MKYEKYREYYQGKYHLSDAEMEAFIKRQQANGAKYSDAFRKAIVAICQEKALLWLVMTMQRWSMSKSQLVLV